MKSTIFITKILFCMLLFMPVISVYGNIYEEKREVILHGESEDYKSRSLLIPVEAYTDGYQLAVTFFNVSITGNAGVMETRTVSFTDFQTEFFISQYEAGVYSIQITTTKGTSLQGVFEKL